MTLSYRKILKQAYEIIKDNKFLWIFGLFLSLGSLMNYNLYGNGGESMSDPAVLLMVLIVFLVIVLYFRAKAGMIIGIKSVLDKQATDFWRAFGSARVFFNRILILSILTEFGIILLGLILGWPVAFLFIHHFTYRAVLLLVFAGLIFIPTGVVAILINVLSPMFVVIFDLKIQEAISSAFDLINKYRIRLIIFGLLLFLFELLPLFLAAIVVKLHQGLNSVLISAALFLIFNSVISAFTQSAWVLAFLELIEPQKLEEEQEKVSSVPEVIG